MLSSTTAHRRAAWSTALAWSAWWALPIWTLAGYWAAYPQYSYGWLVPILTLFLFWRRWETCPEPGRPSRWAAPLIVAALALVAPTWLVGQANPGWRFIPSLLAVSAVAATIGLTARLGGAAWARHFAFPALFFLTAVPWPSIWEDTVVQRLMKVVAAATVALLNLFGTAAVQRGNLVEVAAGTLGVDEACSGLRSLQAALMASLFLGEFYRLKTGARVVLVLAGFLAAMVTNVARTSFLSYSAAQQGIEAVGRWHDPAGFTVLTVCLVLIALLAQRLPLAELPPGHKTSLRDLAFPHAGLGVFLFAGLALVLVGAELWYDRPPAPKGASWTVVPPAGAQEEALSPKAQALLVCDRDRVASWRSEDGIRWNMFFLEWEPSRSRFLLLVRNHRPDVCLPAVGLTESGPRTRMSAKVAGFDLTFQVLEFQSPSEERMFVFYGAWETGPGEPGRSTTFDDDSRLGSLRRVWRRQRVVGQQTAEFVLTGAPNREAAEAAMRAQLEMLIQPERGARRPL